jgi:hypothetical protein
MELTFILGLLVLMAAMAMSHVSPRAWAALRVRIQKRKR